MGIVGVLPGVDLVEVSQVADSIERFGERYLLRLFCPAELAPSAAWAPARRAEHLAGRFAGKEAVFKALRMPGSTTLPWRQIEITGTGGAPRVVLHGHVEAWARQRGITGVELSISHDAGQAAAFALAQCAERPEASDGGPAGEPPHDPMTS